MAATFDRRRVQAPETSAPPIFASEPESGPSRRQDRKPNEARPIFLKAGLISQAHGSGYIESGNVKIACSVYGPRPKQPPYAPQGTLSLEVKFAPFASHPRRAPLRVSAVVARRIELNAQDTEPAALSSLLTQLLLPSIQLHLLPKSSVDVFLLVLESDSTSNVLSAGLTVSSLAIADAGIPMFGLCVGSVVARAADGEMLFDPSKEDDTEAQGQVTVGVMPALSKVTSLWTSGEIEVEDVCDMIDLALLKARDTHTVVAQTLLEEG